MPRALRLALASGLALALLLAQWSIAQAHAFLVSASPGPNGFFTNDQPPTQVQITFNEEVIPVFSSISVLNEAGQTVTNGSLKLTNPERTRLATFLPTLSPGAYTVSWNVVSAADGHATSGSYGFGVGVVPVSQTSSELPAVTIAGVASRWLGLTGQILLLGLFAFYLFVWRPARRSALAVDEGTATDTLQRNGTDTDGALVAQGLRVGWIGLVLVALGLLLALAGQPATFRASSGAEFASNLEAWLAARYGADWLIRFLLGVTLGVVLALLGRGQNDRIWGHTGDKSRALNNWLWPSGLVLVVALSLTATFVSHSAALPDNAALAVISDGAHVLATGVWVGGLVYLVLATRLTRWLSFPKRGELNRLVVLNFSTMAAMAVGALLISGGYLAWQHVGSWAALFKTPYGLALLAKVGLAIPALAAAAVNLLIIRPRLEGARSLSEKGQAVLHHRFGRLVLVEAGFTLAVVAAAGLLTNIQPGRDALSLVEQSQVTSSQPADDLNVTMTIAPGQWGQTNTFDIYVLDRYRQPLANAIDVSVRFTFLDKALGTNSAAADPVEPGHFRVTGAYFTLGGTWQAEVAIRRPDAYDAFAAFKFDTTTQGVIQALNSATWTDRLVRWFNANGRLAAIVVFCLFVVGWAVLALQATGGRLSPALAVALVPSVLAAYLAATQFAMLFASAPTTPSGDPRALALLSDSEAAMNKLTSVQLLRVTHGDTGAVLTETIRFQAPNMFDDQMSNGAENLAQGVSYFNRGPQDKQWQAAQTDPYVFPAFNLSRQAVDGKLGRQETVEGRPAQQIVFTVYILRNPIPYARWIDVDTKLILHETMDALGHHMLSIYHDFNAPVTIVLPSVKDIGPTPTVSR